VFVARRATAGHVCRNQAVAFRQALANFLQRQIVIQRLAAGVTHRHGLNEAQGETVFEAELDHVLHLVVIDALHHHHVDLDRGEVGRAGRHQAVEYLLQAAAGDVTEPLGTQRIEADIDAIHAGLLQFVRVSGQTRGIGGQRQVFQLRQGGKACRQFGQPLAYQRLATGESHHARAQFGEGTDDAFRLLVPRLPRWG